MIAAVIVILVIGALVAAIWGRETAQGLLGGVGCIALVIAIAFVILLLSIMHSMNAQPASYVPSPVYTAPPNYAPVESSYPRMGVVLEPLKPQNGAKYGLLPGQGVFVKSVAPGSGAAQAGIMATAYISTVDGVLVSSQDDVIQIERRHRAGDVIPVIVLGSGKQFTNYVTLNQ